MKCFGWRANVISATRNLEKVKSGEDLSPRGLSFSDDKLVDRIKALERAMEKQNATSLPVATSSKDDDLSQIVEKIEARLAAMESNQLNLSTETSRKLDALALAIGKKLKEAHHV